MLQNIFPRRTRGAHLSPVGGVVVQGLHPALQGHRGQGPVHGLLPHQPEGGGWHGLETDVVINLEYIFPVHFLAVF